MHSKKQGKSTLSEVFLNPVAFFRFITGYEPTSYQRKILLDSSKSITVRASRQSGKTEVVAVKVLWNTLLGTGFQTLILAPTLRQSSIIFNKIDMFLLKNDFLGALCNYHSRTYIRLDNGSEIYNLTGRNAESVRGYSPHLIVIDEAAFIKDEVFTAIEPSMATTNGSLILISTPFGKTGRFYESHSKLDYFSRYHVPYTDCPFLNQEYVEHEKLNKTEAEFKQEYEAEFVEEADVFFSMALIKEALSGIEKSYEVEAGWDYYLGVDQARYGTDECVYIVVRHKQVHVEEPIGQSVSEKQRTDWEEFHKFADEYGDVDVLEMSYWDATAKNDMTDIMGRIKVLHENFDFRKIYIDSAFAPGTGDVLTESGLPIVPNNFTQREKHDMYTNLKIIMEKSRAKQGIILRLPDLNKLIWQLAEMQYAYSSNGLMKIHHPDKPNAHDDWCFVAGTKILTESGHRNIEDLKSGDLVMTRNGLKPVLGVGSRETDVISRFGLTGTPDHPFITKRGITPFYKLHASDILYIWNEKQSAIEEKSITDILNQKEGILESITGVTTNGKLVQNLSTDKFIKTTLGQSQKDSSFITRTETQKITSQKISKLCQEENTTQYISQKNNELKQEKTLPNMLDLKQVSGINQKRGENGIGNTRLNVVLGKRRVYNLKISDSHEYFANGVLVHNCDGLALATSFKIVPRGIFTAV